MAKTLFDNEELRAIILAGFQKLGYTNRWIDEGFDRYTSNFRVIDGKVHFEVTPFKKPAEPEKKPSVLDKLKDKAREFNFNDE